MPSHREMVMQAFGMCSALEQGNASACLQLAANLNPAAVIQSKSLSNGSLLVTSALSDKLTAFLVSFSVKLRLQYSDIIGSQTFDDSNLLRIAFPLLSDPDELNSTDSKKIALRCLFVIRLYQQELSEMFAKLQARS